MGKRKLAFSNVKEEDARVPVHSWNDRLAFAESLPETFIRDCFDYAPYNISISELLSSDHNRSKSILAIRS